MPPNEPSAPAPRRRPGAPPSLRPVADPGTTARLRAALRAAGFTPDGCLDVLGAAAYAALSRSETVPALRATRGGNTLDGLIRLFLLQEPVPRDRIADALPVEDCLAAGWLTEEPDGSSGSVLRATVDIRPYGDADDDDWWIVSDLGCAVGGAGGIGGGRGPAGVDPADLVLGVGGASTTLSGIAVRRPVRSALDLGTGSGVQALHASRHASALTATDLNPRALHFAGLTLALSGVAAERVELLEGSLFEPVGERKFDVILSNPPFVISPAGREGTGDGSGTGGGTGDDGHAGAKRGRLTYRDGGLPGDELCRRIVSEAPAHLAEGGTCQLLANWQHVKGEDWRERLASWIAPTGCDAWVVQREVQDPAQYAELWLRDAGDHRAGAGAYAARYDEWLEAFERDGVEGIGFGWITLRAGGRNAPGGPVVRIEEWGHPVEQPLGPEIADWFARQDFLRAHDDAALLGACLRLADGVVQEQVGAPGAEDPEHVVLRQQRGMLRATKVDTVGAGFAGACDGTLPAGRILDAIAQIVGEEPVALRARTPESIRLLVEQGFLLPATPAPPAPPATSAM